MRDDRRQRRDDAAGAAVMGARKRRFEIAGPPGRRGPSGAQLYAELEAEAARRGVSMAALCLPLAKFPVNWAERLRDASRPRPATVARVRALIAGEPIPGGVSGRRVLPVARPAAVLRVEVGPPVPDVLPLPRRTCFACGATSMTPCVHLIRSGWVEAGPDQERRP